MPNFVSLKNFYTRHNFTLGFAAISLLVLVIGLFILNDLRRTNQATRKMSATSISDLALIGELQYHMQEARRQALYSLTTTDPNLQIQYADESRASDATVLNLIKAYTRINLETAKNAELADLLAHDWDAYLATRNETIALILEGNTKEAVALDLKEGVPLFNRIRDDLRRIKEHYKEESARQIRQEAAASRNSFIEMIVLLLATLSFAAWTMYRLQQRMLHAVQKKAEQAEEERAFAEAIISSAGEGIVVYDRALHFLVWNQTMERFTGIPAADVLGKYAPTLFPWMTDEGIDQQLEMALSGATVFSPDLCVDLPDGRSTWRSSVYSPHRNSKGDIVGIIGMISDVTQRKHDEQELRAVAARLEQSNRELQDFAFVASHDLQEPLRKIQAFGDRLKSKYGAVLDETGQDYLARMQNAALRMQVLINDLLSFSRVTTKAKPFEMVDLEEIVRAVVSDLEIRIEQTGGAVEIDPLPIIDADPTQMRQLMQNLISNALKFHKSDVPPRVKVTGERVNGDAETCELTVTDNGIGFEEKYLDRIFTLFQRLHGRSEYEGTGVGLAVCRKIVERHGGQITAQSVPQQGAKFIVSLPARQWKAAAGK